jgi:alpha-tubulin suppressor-like RCC1 family protein
MLLIEQLLARGASAPAEPPPAEAAGPGFIYTWGDNTLSGLGRVGEAPPLLSWTAVSSGARHTLAIRSDALLFAWGFNQHGELGDETNSGRSSPVQIGTSSWTAVSAGHKHSLAIRSDGKLFAWGRNDYGQLGNGEFGAYGGPYNSSTNKSSPVQIGTSSWTAIAAGSSHSVAIRSGGSLFAWGRNNKGQLGLGGQINQSSPVQIGTSSWTSVSAGFEHTLAIRSGGSLFTWGSNTRGQCGRFEIEPVFSWTAIASGGYHTLAIRSDGKLFAWGKNNYGQLGNGESGGSKKELAPVQIGNSSWTAVSAGFNHSMAIRSGGSLFAWGQNNQGQLGATEPYGGYRSSPTQVGASTWSSVRCGKDHNLAIRSDSKLFAWGLNNYGQLGNGNQTTEWSPVQIGTSNWTAIAAGNSHSLAIRSGGSLFAWGGAYFGALGLGNQTNRSSPVQVGSSLWTTIAAGGIHSLGIRSDAKLFSWGFNLYGELGNGESGWGTQRSSPVQIGTSNWVAVAAGTYHTLAIRSGGSLFSWGQANYGQLGKGVGPYGYYPNQSSPVQVGSSLWTTVSACRKQSIAIRSGGGLFTWGQNSQGQLGLGDQNNRNSPVQVGGGSKTVLSSPGQVGTSSWTAVSAGHEHSLAIRSGGSLFTWGRNNDGQLGLSDTTDRNSPVQVGTSSWTRVAAGQTASFAIQSDGYLFAWGKNDNQQLANTSYGVTNSPVQIGYSSWTAITAGKGLMGTYDGVASSILGITTNNILYSWGRGQYGQLGSSNTQNRSEPGTVGGNALIVQPNPGQVGDNTTSWTAISSYGWHNLAIRSDGALFSWGHNPQGQLGFNTYGVDVNSPTQLGTSSWTAIAAGARHSLAIRSDGALFSWGANTRGELGNGNYTNPNFWWLSYTSPVQVGTSSWTAVAASYGISFGIRADGRLFGWGYNNVGQLGLGQQVLQRVPSPTQVGTSSWAAVSAGAGHTLAIRSDNKLFAWGSNSVGQLGLGNTVNTNSPVQVGTSNWRAASAGGAHSLAIRSDNKLFGWGWSRYAQVGLGYYNSGYGKRFSSPVQIGTSNWSAVSAGDKHSLAISSDGALFAWGRNAYSQLGVSSSTIIYDPTQIGTSSWTAVDAARWHSVGLLKIT